MIKIAIAEDNSFLLKSILDKLAFFNDLKVKHTAQNGNELINLLMRDRNVDIILMDIQMPVMNGIEATQIIKKNYPQIKIMMLTIFEDDENIFNSIKAGANGYLLKETDPNTLYGNIRELMSGGAPMTPCVALKTLDLLRNPEKIRGTEKDKNSVILSERQKEILEQLSKGLNYNQIAENLIISPGTVRKHIENIYEKLHAHSKIEALRKAKQQGLIND
jgi:DNA-binding NarL/FixJ family response regulator